MNSEHKSPQPLTDGPSSPDAAQESPSPRQPQGFPGRVFYAPNRSPRGLFFDPPLTPWVHWLLCGTVGLLLLFSVVLLIWSVAINSR